MKTKNLNISITILYATLLTLTVSFFLFFSTQVHAVNMTCSFDRDLDIGIEGDDVLCLQKFLNEAGYKLTEDGAGAPGQETNRFGGLTRDALSRWQLDNDIYPASGYFGPLTRTALTLVSDIDTPASTPKETTSADDTAKGALDGFFATLDASDRKQAEDLLALFGALGITKTTQTQSQNQTQTGSTDKVVSAVNTSSEFKTLIVDAIKMLREAEDAIDDSDEDETALIVARDNYQDARDDLQDAVFEYFTGDLEDAIDYAEDAYDNAKDAFEDAGGTTVEDELEDRLDDLEDDLDTARDDIDDMEDDGADVDDAHDLLEEAEEYLQKAEDALDDDELADAEDYLDEAEDLIEDALDAVVSEDEKEADDAIDDANDAINDAYDEIDEARDDDEDVDDAEDYIDMAEDFIDDAEDAYDDEEYEDAIRFAEKAEDYAEKAVDSL